MAVIMIMMAGGMIGFVAGMLFMRDSYLGLLIQERMEKRQIMADASRREDQARRIGYAVGVRLYGRR